MTCSMSSETPAKMGKATGMDENKNTFVRLYGRRARARELIAAEAQRRPIGGAGLSFEDSGFFEGACP